MCDKDCFKDTTSKCINSPSGLCSNKGNLDKCVKEKRCVKPECTTVDRPFESKIIKK